MLKANAALARNTNGASILHRQLADALDKYSTEHSRAGKTGQRKCSTWQKDLKAGGNARSGNTGGDAKAVNLLQSENDRLKTQLSALQSAANNATAADEEAAKLEGSARVHCFIAIEGYRGDAGDGRARKQG